MLACWVETTAISLAARQKNDKSKLNLTMLHNTRDSGFGLRGLIWTLRKKSFQCSIALE